MGDSVVDFAAVAQSFFDLCGIVDLLTHVLVLLVNVFLLLFFLDMVVFILIIIGVFLSFRLIGLVRQDRGLVLFYLKHFLAFLKSHFAAELLQVLVGLLKDLHESGVLLRVDQVDVRVDVVVFEGLDTVAFFLVDSVLLFALFLVEVSLGVDGVSFNF